jgi:predicted DNA-binding protein (MmcQ/YjbR family)
MAEPGRQEKARLARASSLAMGKIEYADVAPEVMEQIRSACLRLPETFEKPAWTGAQWRIRNRTFAHVLAVDTPEGPVTIMTFRSEGAELDALRRTGHPFFRPAWGKNGVGMVIDDGVDWDEVAELLTESYCVMAPKKLVALIDRPEPDRADDEEAGPP